MEERPSVPRNPFESADEVFLFFEEFTNFEQKQKQTIREYRLDRMHEILSLFEDPHRDFDIVHVAGSKGKGSTSLYIAHALEALGIKTGLYSSPHVETYRERITFAGRFAPEALLVEAGNTIREGFDRVRNLDLEGSGDPTTFELLTLLAFLVFRNGDCSCAVIETGIGGRLDATNVVDPLASVITPIELEHTDVLGTTLPQIASEKAGIIKEGKPVFVSRQHDEAMEVLEKTAAERGAPLHLFSDEVSSASYRLTRSGTEIHAALRRFGELELTIGMLGSFQAENALLALIVVDSLKNISLKNIASDSPTSKDELRTICTSFRSTRLPGRLELMGERPPILLDGAHTPASVRLALEAYDELFSEPPICIFGSVYGKNAKKMAEILSPRCREIIISRPGIFKPSRPEELHTIFSGHRKDTQLLVDAGKAFERAVSLSAERIPILVIGSFYMVAGIRPHALSHCREEKRRVESSVEPSTGEVKLEPK